MEIEEGDAIRLIAAIEDLNGSLARLERVSGVSLGGINNSNKFSFGSAGIWICVTCVLMLFMSNFNQGQIITMQAQTITDMQRKYDRMQDYLNAIYAQAPHLRPKENK